MSNKEYNSEFANALKAAGLSVAEFCRQSGTPERTAINWKTGERRTPPIALWALKLYMETQNN